MRGLRDLLFKDWLYKLIAFSMGISLWFLLNLGERIPMSLERPLEVFNQEEGYTYKLEKRKVRIKLRVMERLVPENMLEGISAGVDVKGLREGEYLLKVKIGNLPRFIVSVEKVDPEYIKVRVLKAPNGGK